MDAKITNSNENKANPVNYSTQGFTGDPNFVEFCQFGEWAYEKLAVLDCNSGNVVVISPDRRLQTTEEIEIFLSEHCGYHLSEINWMVMKGDVVFLNENDF